MCCQLVIDPMTRPLPFNHCNCNVAKEGTLLTVTWFEEVFLGEFNLFVRYSYRDEVFCTITAGRGKTTIERGRGMWRHKSRDPHQVGMALRVTDARTGTPKRRKEADLPGMASLLLLASPICTQVPKCKGRRGKCHLSSQLCFHVAS